MIIMFRLIILPIMIMITLFKVGNLHSYKYKKANPSQQVTDYENLDFCFKDHINLGHIKCLEMSFKL